ncbi:protein FAM110C [Hypanus sabinus]|uniref:protein FAM110C n=1 Tax=Hypanus sabinus TaxID=79690 RepID=UPI0028C3D6B8|nr:protein FAM110C [Hypanus sabinus]XP_059837988.1 protein FAM110C [Hypanus sabinus]XP_059837989.1 protein FAM110C [Hypanus sabinus]
MPSEISAPAGMQSALSPSLPLRLLTKGPSYLRSQMEGDRRDRPSAVERLAADKAKYVKSPAARGRKLEPSGLGSFSSEEDSSSGASSNRENHLESGSHQQTRPRELQPSIVRRSGFKRQLRPDSLVIYRQKCEFVRGAPTTSSNRSSKSNRSLVRRLLPGSGGGGDTLLQSEAGTTLEERLADGTEVAASQGAATNKPAAPQGAAANTPAAPQGAAANTPAASRGAAANTPAAPRGAAANTPAAPRGAAANTPAAPQGAAANTPAAPQGAAANTPAASRGAAANTPAAPRGAAANTPAAPRGAAANTPAAPRGAAANTPAAPRGAAANTPAAPQGAAANTSAAPQGAAANTSAAPQGDTGRTKEPLKRRGGGTGLRRSHSDLSYRYSRACSGLDSFFEHCGLEPEVMEDLVREKFAATSDSLALKFRSVSSPDSESELSRHSSGGSERLQVQKKPPPSALSVIERNARVIQWLYGCKRAQESKGKPTAVLV